MMKILNSSYGNLTLHQGFRRFPSYRAIGLLVVLGSWLFLNSCSLFHGLPHSAAPPIAQGYRVAVQQVLSGNSLEVTGLEPIGQSPRSDLQDKRVKVRLIGIDVPSLAQSPWGEESRQYLQQTLERSSLSPARIAILELDTQERDQYDRFLGYLWRDQTFVNEKILRGGQALVSSYFPNIRYESRLESAQHEARLLGVGIWNPDRPLRQSPAEFWQQKSIDRGKGI